MKLKNIIINVSSVLLISAALPAIAHEKTDTGIHHKEMVEAPTAHEHTPSATDTHYMMHGGDDHQGHLMEGATHGENQATEHEKQLIPDTPSNKDYKMNPGGGPQAE
ncbi:hypothetical protein [Neptunomonas sp.]|uniref:hypothetical protein n=1 Tax=Neptunomonas sp. TaxID=1971898 RepID=UPI003564580E